MTGTHYSHTPRLYLHAYNGQSFIFIVKHEDICKSHHRLEADEIFDKTFVEFKNT